MQYVLFAFVFIGLVLYAFGSTAYERFVERKRTAAFAQAAADLGFEFDPTSRADLPEDLAGLYLFTRGDSRQTRNIVRGGTANPNTTVFDYSYSISGDGNATTYYQTVACFRTGNLRMPTFSLRPECVLHRIGSLVGMQDIDFDTHPTFSKAYLLKGPKEDAIRKAFSHEVLKFFEDRTGLCVEANSKVIVFYRQNKWIDPMTLRDFLAEGLEMMTMFHDRARKLNS